MNRELAIDTNWTLYEALQNVIRQYPERDALVLGEARDTYRQFGERVDALAAGLSQLGIGKGDKVGLILPTCLENLYAFFALAKIGAPFVPMSPQLRTREVRHILGDSESVAVITVGQMMGHDYVAMMEGVRSELSNLRHVIVYGEGGEGQTIPLAELLAAEPAALDGEPVSSDDSVGIVYTAGTTGLPKGAVHTHRTLVTLIGSGTQIFQPEDLVAMLNPFPLFHLAGIAAPLIVLLSGGKLVLAERFHPQEALRLTEEERVSFLIGAPVMVKLMLGMPDFDQRDLSSLRVCAMGGAPSPPELIRAVKARMGCGVFNALGMTEAGYISVTRPFDPEDVQARTVGRPAPGVEIKIVDDERREVPIGQAGEIVCRSPTLMQSYYKNPEGTAEVVDEEGWYYTGDVGSLDEEGYLSIFDRKRDMLIRGGENIYPAEVETFLVTHPKIQMAAVIGVPSEVGGERVRAYILPMEGAELTETEVMSYCRGQIAMYKLPEEVRFVESFPLSALRKVQKYKLREEALKELEKRRD